MKSPFSLLKLTLCGPGDVAKEIQIAQEVITAWNLQHGEPRGLFLKHQHWSTDTHPDLRDRPQGVVNGQIIDDADIIVAVFWSRFGTPTGRADSGTQEEIERGVKLGRKVMVYFSDLESITGGASQDQAERLARFRQKLTLRGLCWSFQSRQQFRELFTRHLALTVNELSSLAVPAKAPRPQQTVKGNGNTVVGGDYTVINERLVVRPVIERREGSLTNAEQKQVQNWITELAEGTARVSRQRAFQMWWQRFKNRMQVTKYEDLESTRMPEAEAWFREQRAIQVRGLKTKAPDLWRNSRMGAIKMAMKSMGRTNEDYYPELAVRLDMKKPFASLTELTKTDLERVYTMVLRDARTS
jgi:hypothetical protein